MKPREWNRLISGVVAAEAACDAMTWSPETWAAYNSAQQAFASARDAHDKWERRGEEVERVLHRARY